MTDAPSPRSYATAVWTGTEMIVWGGSDTGTGNPVGDGSAYNPSTDTWRALPTSGAPSARLEHAAVWTGEQMLIAGGRNGSTVPGGFFAYDPQSNAWSEWTSAGGPYAQRYGHAAVWTGSAMIIWGGTDDTGTQLNTGTRFFPATQTVLGIATSGAPVARADPSAVWTGNVMIVWGGWDNTNGAVATGGRYNPQTNTWQTLPDPLLTGRYAHTAVWTGSEMIIWGGRPTFPPSSFNDGARYSPGANQWTAVSSTDCPIERSNHTAVWTGIEMIVWGGTQPHQGPFYTGGRYAP